jgi:hypothetical protein
MFDANKQYRLLVLAFVAGLGACSGDSAQVADPVAHFEYPPSLPASCPSGPLKGSEAKVVDGKLSYRVRTPLNYDARYAHLCWWFIRRPARARGRRSVIRN